MRPPLVIAIREWRMQITKNADDDDDGGDAIDGGGGCYFEFRRIAVVNVKTLTPLSFFLTLTRITHYTNNNTIESMNGN